MLDTSLLASHSALVIVRKVREGWKTGTMVLKELPAFLKANPNPNPNSVEAFKPIEITTLNL